MANIIFYEFHKNKEHFITKQNFIDFLLNNKNLISLFDFLNHSNKEFNNNWRQQKRLSHIYS